VWGPCGGQGGAGRHSPWMLERSVILNLGSPASSLPSASTSVNPRAPIGIMGCGRERGKGQRIVKRQHNA
jgi:hypothetical protein